MRSLVAVMAISSVAFAQAAPTANDNEAARAHFMAGSAYYEQANYADAVKEFNEAYRLSQRPDLLYNIALAYERLEKLDEAIGALQKYLTLKPAAQDRNTILSRIENLQKRRDAALAAPPPPPTVTQPPPPPSQPPPRKPRHVASLTVGAIGLAALAAAIGTGAAALRDKNALDDVCPNMRCPPSKQGQIDEGLLLSHSTDGLIAVGSALVLTGVILLIVESRHPAPTRVAVQPGAGGLSVRF